MRMASVLGFVLIIGAIVLYCFAVDNYNKDSDEVKCVRKLMVFLILSGAGIVLINSWIVKPILLVLGG